MSPAIVNAVTVRQLIICCDGTNNTLTGGDQDTNVLKLVKVLDPDRKNQLLYYDPGVGSPDQLPATGIRDAIRRKLDRLTGLASGKGIYENIGSAYQFLIENYLPGDQIFLFGFSRGAFTARCVTGMVNLFGILRKESIVLIPTLISVYFSNATTARDKRNRRRVARQIRTQFTCSVMPRPEIHFVGVWDTVASVGVPYLLDAKITSDARIKGKKIMHVRQALSLDEHRAAFRPRLYREENGTIAQTRQTVQQRWFRGSHSDVGGGYDNGIKNNESALAVEVFFWMVAEAVQCHLRINDRALEAEEQKARTAQGQIPVMHDQCLETPYWGVTGLEARDFDLPVDSGSIASSSPALRSTASGSAAQYKMVTRITPVAHGTASNYLPVRLKNPFARHWKAIIFFVMLCILTWLIVGAFSYAAFDGLVPMAAWSLSISAQGAIAFDSLQRGMVFVADNRMCELPGLSASFHSGFAVAALVTDFVFIAAYSWLLGLVSAWSFTTLVGLRQVGAPMPLVSRFKLGWPPCIVVVADVAENILTLTTLAFISGQVMCLSSLFALMVAIANVVKWVALVLCLPLIVIATVRRLLDRR